MRRSDEFWNGSREAQRLLVFLVLLVIVLGAWIETELVGHIPIAFGTLGTFLSAVYIGRAYVDGKERNPDLHRALGDRHMKTGQNPTPPRNDP